MTRMTTDVEALAQLLQQGLLLALTSLVSCAGVIGILLVLDVRLALAAFIVLPIQAIVTVWFWHGSRRSYLRSRDAISTVNAELQESLSGVRVTQSLGRDDNNAPRFAARSVRYRDARLKSMQLMSIYFASSQLLSTIAKAIILWYGARLIDQGTLSTGLLIAFLLVPRPVLQPAATTVRRVRSMDPITRFARPARRAPRNSDLDSRGGATDRSGPRGRAGAVARCPLRLLQRCARGAARCRPADQSGRVRRARRHDGRRQVDVRQARRPLLRPDRRQCARRRHRSARSAAPRVPAQHRLRAAGAVPVLRDHSLEHRLRPARAPAMSRWSARRGPSVLTISLRRCPMATSRRSPRRDARCQPASASCCAWRGRS